MGAGEAYIFILIFCLQENMTRMLLVADVNESIKKHQAHIISSLKDPDIRYISLGPTNEVFEMTEEGMKLSWNW